MLSIIICSCSEERLAAITQNIHDTIGTTPYEIIGIDNRKQPAPIAQVYNKGARQAQGEHLLFVHEDIIFHSSGWGDIICSKLQEPTCGIIGFAGSKMRLPITSGWGQSEESEVCNFCQTEFKRWIRTHCNHDFEEVITLDGLAMFCRKDAWEQYPFDEKELTEFHAYDIDFTLQMAHAGYKNYVCATDRVYIEHLSSGNFSTSWMKCTIRMQKGKWGKLPVLCTPDFADFLKKNYQSQVNSAYKAFYEHLCRMGFRSLSELPEKTTEELREDLFWEVRDSIDYQYIKEQLKTKNWNEETRRFCWEFIRKAHTYRKYKLFYKIPWYLIF